MSRKVWILDTTGTGLSFYALGMVGIEIMCLVWDIAFKNFHQNCGLYLSVCVLQLHIAQVWFGRCL